MQALGCFFTSVIMISACASSNQLVAYGGWSGVFPPSQSRHWLAYGGVGRAVGEVASFLPGSPWLAGPLLAHGGGRGLCSFLPGFPLSIVYLIVSHPLYFLGGGGRGEGSTGD